MKVGIRVECSVCGRTKKPQGRSAPSEGLYCDQSCAGYYEPPKPGDLWPGESAAGFGYPVSNDATEDIE